MARRSRVALGCATLGLLVAVPAGRLTERRHAVTRPLPRRDADVWIGRYRPPRRADHEHVAPRPAPGQERRSPRRFVRGGHRRGDSLGAVARGRSPKARLPADRIPGVPPTWSARLPLCSVSHAGSSDPVPCTRFRRGPRVGAGELEDHRESNRPRAAAAWTTNRIPGLGGHSRLAGGSRTRRRARREGTPRLLLVAAEAEPPLDWDGLTDWVRLPVADRDLCARVAALQRQASSAPPPDARRVRRVVARCPVGCAGPDRSPARRSTARALRERREPARVAARRRGPPASPASARSTPACSGCASGCDRSGCRSTTSDGGACSSRCRDPPALGRRASGASTLRWRSRSDDASSSTSARHESASCTGTSTSFEKPAATNSSSRSRSAGMPTTITSAGSKPSRAPAMLA